MTRNEIDSIFTSKVTNFLAQGYVINPGTMDGTQGEIAHVDLRKGNEIIRVWMESESNYGKALDNLVIRVGRTDDPYLVNREYHDFGRGIWNNRLELIEEIRFAVVENGIYCTLEEGDEIERKRKERLNNRYDSDFFRDPVDLTGNEAVKAIALKYVKRQPKMKRSTLSDIQKVVRKARNTYVITARGKSFTLC